MKKFVLVMGDAPHMKLSRSGTEFSTSGMPMVFDDYDTAFTYVFDHTEDIPMKGIRVTIIEDIGAEKKDRS